jgi:hypothetical protein
LEVIQHKLRKPRLTIYIVPDEITTENVVAIIKTQNPELLTNGEDIEEKYKFKKQERERQHCGGSRPPDQKTNSTISIETRTGNM